MDLRQNLVVSAFFRHRLAHDIAIDTELGFDCVWSQPFAPDCADIFMQNAAVKQFTDQEAHAACSMEMVHIGKSIWIDACQKWNDIRNF